MSHKTPALWRTLEEQLKGGLDAGDDGARFVDRPRAPVTHKPDAEVEAPVGRRAFLQVMGAMFAMGAGCTKQPEERIVPYVKAPEDVVPGTPLFYASASVLGGLATGVLVEQNEGRPTKVEGNPEHPASLGATDAFAQAATFDLYDPSRSKTPLHLGAISGYGELLGALQTALLHFKSTRGKGLTVLTGAVGSPTLKTQLDELLAAMPLAKWHWYESVHRRGAREGAALAFGQDLEARFDLGAADVVVSLDADLLRHGRGPARLHAAVRVASQGGARRARRGSTCSSPRRRSRAAAPIIASR